MDLSVVIVNWNSGDHLGRLLDSLAPLQEELRETWVVDNASRDSSLDGFRSYPEVRILALTENLGFAGAANEAISRCRSSFILLISSSIISLILRSLPLMARTTYHFLPVSVETVNCNWF